MSIEAITVSELISELQKFNGDLKVVSVVDYGDRANTMQAVAATSPDTGTVSSSGYSSSGYALDEDNEKEDSEEVLVLNMHW